MLRGTPRQSHLYVLRRSIPLMSPQAILVVRFGLNNVLKTIASLSKSPVPWDKSKLYYVLREVRSLNLYIL